MTGGGDNLLVAQGGGPTPVLNTSLFGVLDEARRHGRRRVLGARFGVAGLIADDIVDLTDLPDDRLHALKTTPGAALGSTRHKPDEAEMGRILDTLARHGVGHLVVIGGNGTLRGGDAIQRAAGDAIRVVGVPKTIDNDIPNTDRCPGFGSAARHAAQLARDLGMDVRALPQPVSILETMGRGVGWLAASTVLARHDAADAPHLIRLPETPFDQARFLADVDRVVSRHGWCVAVVNEGLRDAAGRPIFEAGDAAQRDALGRAVPGGVAAHLAGIVAGELGLRCRSEKPGLCGRNSMLHVSAQDQRDAEAVGRAAVRAALADGRRGVWAALEPIEADSPVRLRPFADAAGDRAIPADWLDADADVAVTADFARYAAPIVGDLVPYAPPLT